MYTHEIRITNKSNRDDTGWVTLRPERRGKGRKLPSERHDVINSRHMATTEETAKDVVRRYTEEGYNSADAEVIQDTVADDVVVTGLPGTDGPIEGIEAYLNWASEMLETFPDFHGEIEDLIAEGDTVAVAWTLSATQEGAFGDIPATGESFSVDAQATMHIEDGQIAEKRFVMDELKMLEQLGVMD